MLFIPEQNAGLVDLFKEKAANGCKMRIALANPIDYFNDPHAPEANSIVPAASAIITNDEGKILLHQCSDNDLWALPGGAMEIGENIAETVAREVKEETGFDVEPKHIVGIYTDPHHVIAFSFSFLVSKSSKNGDG